MTRVEWEEDLLNRIIVYTDKYVGGVGVKFGKKTCAFLGYDIKHDVTKSFNIRLNKTDFQTKGKFPLLADHNYYVMPRGVYNSVKDIVPMECGVVIPKGRNTLEIVKYPKIPKTPKLTRQECLVLIIQHLTEVSKNYLKVVALVNRRKFFGKEIFDYERDKNISNSVSDNSVEEEE